MISIIPEEEVVSMSKWIPITKAYKYEMSPSKNQEVKKNQTLSICRHLYNDTLAERKEAWENGQWNIQYDDQQNYLPELRNENDKNSKYLQEVYAQVEQDVIRRVDKAYKNFFRRVKENKDGGNSGNGISYKKPGFPRFKGYGRYDSFTFPQYGYGCHIVDKYGNEDDLNGNYIRLSKIGDVKFIKHREIGDTGIPYQIKTVTVKREVDKWFVSFAVDTFMELKVPVDIYKKLDFKPLDDLIYSLFEARMGKNKIYESIKKEVRNLLIEISKLDILSDKKEKEIKNIEELHEKCIGIDMGLDNLVMLSTKQKVDPQKFLRMSEKRLAIEQRRLSKKQIYEKEIEIIDKEESKKQKKEVKVKKKIKINSKNREKQRIKVAKVHKKIANQRRNFNHNISRTLVDNFDLIVFEELNIQQMMRNRRYSKSIADASWYQLQMFANYKAEWASKLVDFVPSKDTTKECSKCHKINEMPIWKRTMVCECGNIEDRDIDASFVIRDRSVIYQELKKKVLEKIIRPVNREAINSRDAITQTSTNREAIAAIQASGEETSTQIEMSGRVLSVNQETLSNTKDGKLAYTILQAPPFNAGKPARQSANADCQGGVVD